MVISWTKDCVAFIPLFDSSQGTTGLNDLSLNGNNNTADGAAVFNTAKDAFIFDESADTCTYALDPSFASETQGAVSLWVKANEIGNQILFGVASNEGSETDSQAIYIMGSESGQLRIYSYDGASAKYDADGNTTNVDDNSWHHIVWTSDGSTTKVYLDGNLETLSYTTGSNDGFWFGDMTAGVKSFSAGALYRNINSVVNELDGEMSGVSVFNRNLTLVEVNEIKDLGRNSNPFQGHDYYKLFDGVVLNIDMNGDAKDSSGNEYDGTISGNPTLTVDNLNTNERAYDFDGTGDYITLSTFDSFATIGSGDVTFSLWAKLDSVAANKNFLYMGGTSGNNNDYINLRFDITSGKLASIGRVGVATTDYIYATDAAVIDTWYHMVVTRTGQVAEIYIDGVNTDSADDSEWANTLGLSGASTTVIAGFRVGITPMLGDISRFKVWDRVLSSQEVKYLYDLEKSGYINEYPQERQGGIQ